MRFAAVAGAILPGPRFEDRARALPVAHVCAGGS